MLWLVCSKPRGLWVPVKGEMLQCQWERISAGEAEGELKVWFHKGHLCVLGEGRKEITIYLGLGPRDAGQCLDAEVRSP